MYLSLCFPAKLPLRFVNTNSSPALSSWNSPNRIIFSLSWCSYIKLKEASKASGTSEFLIIPEFLFFQVINICGSYFVDRKFQSPMPVSSPSSAFRSTPFLNLPAKNLSTQELQVKLSQYSSLIWGSRYLREKALRLGRSGSSSGASHFLLSANST